MIWPPIRVGAVRNWSPVTWELRGKMRFVVRHFEIVTATILVSMRSRFSAMFMNAKKMSATSYYFLSQSAVPCGQFNCPFIDLVPRVFRLLVSVAPLTKKPEDSGYRREGSTSAFRNQIACPDDTGHRDVTSCKTREV